MIEPLLESTPPTEPTSNSSFSSILPTLQTAWDATSIAETFCWQKYKYSIVDGYQTFDTNVHLFFGAKYAKAHETFQRLKARGWDHKAATEEVVKNILSNTWDHQLRRPWSSDDQYKNRGTLLRTVTWYFAQFENDPLKPFILANGQPAVELHFDLDIGYTSTLTGEPFHLVGHLDQIRLFEGRPAIVDQKTTKNQITQSYFARFNPNTQVSTYLVAGTHILNGFKPSGPDPEFGQYTPVLDMIIDAAQVKVNSTVFQRGVVSRTPAQLDEWIRDLFTLFEELERRVESNSWPKKDSACGIPHTDPKTGETRYGCPFRAVCSADPSMRDLLLAANFTRRVWDPAKPRTEKELIDA